MAFSIINHVAAQSSDGNTTISTDIDTSGADYLVAVVADYAGIPASVFSDNKSNGWTQLCIKIDTGVVGRIRILSTDATTAIVGSGHNFRATVTGGFPAIAIAALSGSPSPVSCFENSTTAEVTGSSTAQPGSLTPNVDNEILISGIMLNVPGTTVTSIDSGFQITDQLTNISGVAFGVALAYLIETVAAAQNPTWTLSLANTIPLAMATLFPQIASTKRWLLMRR